MKQEWRENEIFILNICGSQPRAIEARVNIVRDFYY